MCLFMGALDTHVLISMATVSDLKQETNSSQQSTFTIVFTTKKDDSSEVPMYTTTISKQTACERTDLGYIEYIHRPVFKDCYVTGLIIKDPAERKKGYGTALIHTLFDDAKKLGCTEIRLCSRLGEDSPQLFYKKFGFEVLSIDSMSGLGNLVLNFTWPWLEKKEIDLKSELARLASRLAQPRL